MAAPARSNGLLSVRIAPSSLRRPGIPIARAAAASILEGCGGIYRRRPAGRRWAATHRGHERCRGVTRQDRTSAGTSITQRTALGGPGPTSVLLASRDPVLVLQVRQALAEGGDRIRLVGVVDPTIESTLAIWREEADVLMIGSSELIQLLHRDGAVESELSEWFYLVSLTQGQHFLEVVGALGRNVGILFCDRDGGLPFAAIEMTLNGYLVVPGKLLQRLLRDQPRLDIVRRLSPNERVVLRCLADALSSEAIAARAGLSLARVRSMITLLIRKLRVRNRTALAVFAASHRTVERQS